ncbi:MAG: HipA N-terminal domain-containing protein [Muribaculaceae bacterium]|nr:HipA N-terminal domain-containing protein [Muribaculaceae bacterium]
MKKAKVYLRNILAGILTEDDMGYEFRYDPDFLKSDKAGAVSLTLPLTEKASRGKVFFKSTAKMDGGHKRIFPAD